MVIVDEIDKGTNLGHILRDVVHLVQHPRSVGTCVDPAC